MIVKVRGTGGQESWRYYDEAVEVQSVVAPRDTEEKITQDQFLAADRNEFFFAETLVSGGKAESQMVCVSFVSRGEFFHVYANTPVYLLNDDGKTIDRLF